jgi:adenylate cyclase
MQEALAVLNQKWRAEGRPELRIGIGLNHGRVVVGNIGSPQRMEFTVIGEVVNVTWRLQELTKQIGEPLIMTETVAASVGDHLCTRSLGRVRIPGLHELEIFTATRTSPIPTVSERDMGALAPALEMV